MARGRIPMTHAIRQRITINIKNKVDCSELIESYEIKGENLAGIRCDRFQRNEEDLSGTNFSGAHLPKAELIKSNCTNCNFAGANMERAVGDSGIFQYCNFNNIFAPYAKWRFAKFHHATFTGAIIRFACEESYGAEFSKDFFEALIRHWHIEGFDRRPDGATYGRHSL